MNLFLKKIRGDKVIWSIVILLAFFSFLPVYSASSNFGNSFVLTNVFKHFAIITVGVLIMFGTHMIPYKYFKGLSKLALPLIIIILLFTSLQGIFLAGLMQVDGLNCRLLVCLFNLHLWLLWY